jgi:hypothetical protein
MNSSIADAHPAGRHEDASTEPPREQHLPPEVDASGSRSSRARASAS